MRTLQHDPTLFYTFDTDTGTLYASTDSGRSFTVRAIGLPKGDSQFKLCGPGPRPTAVYRSDDGAKTWTRISDDAHQWGWIGEVVIGDPRVYGRVYLATNGRGIQYGEMV
ncbi:hypothetical protein GCM10017771_26330 [Streptomyces capitiformicae]|uniref:Glycosyl hydrolase n=1 Tax=Streptomyces capitiformicae TaxID=2014920 RepID=A0A919GNL2_9ACTN|nr:hypothetical protein GCM10017771_26330 [Streptomyces capitiformicae]